MKEEFEIGTESHNMFPIVASNDYEKENEHNPTPDEPETSNRQ